MRMAWIVFAVLASLADSVLFSEFITRYFKFKDKIQNRALVFCSLVLLLFSVIAINNFYFEPNGIDGIICGVITFIFAIIFLNGSNLEKLFMTGIGLSIRVATNFFVILVGSMFVSDIDSIIDREGSLVRFALILVALAIYFGLTRFILIFKNKNDEIRTKQWIFLASSVIVSFILIIFKMETTLENVNHYFQTLYTVLSIILIVALNFIIFIFTSFVNSNNRMTLENTLLKQGKFYEEQNANNIQRH